MKARWLGLANKQLVIESDLVIARVPEIEIESESEIEIEVEVEVEVLKEEQVTVELPALLSVLVREVL